MQVIRPFVYGTESSILKPTEVASDPSHTHRWTVYVRGADGEDISYLIEKVEFKLHESFASPKRVITRPPYEVTETGWGEFGIPITIFFVDPNESPVNVHQMLQLYHKDGHATGPVISENYDQFVFNSPSSELTEILNAHPLESLPRPKPSKIFTPDYEQEELLRIQEAIEKVLAEYEIKKLDISRYEEELKALQDDVKVLQMTQEK